MAIIAAVNFESNLVLLEDGRELPITGYYTSGDPYAPLTAGDAMLSSDRVDGAEEAQVFTVDIPGSDGAALILEMAAFRFAKPTDIN